MQIHPSSPLHELQTEILEALVMGEAFKPLAGVICRRAEDLAPEAHCAILTVAADRSVQVLAAPGLPRGFADSIDGMPLDLYLDGTSGHSAEPVEVHDIANDGRWAPYRDGTLAHGLTACWSSPIRRPDGQVVAAFVFFYRSKRGPTAAEHSIVHTCLHLCAIAHAHDETRKRNYSLAYYDQMTGLPNRRSFDDMMSDRTISDDPNFGLLLVDVNNLKIVNDTMGHIIGDSLLQEIARRVTAIVPSGACRLGGDEFAILVDDCRDHSVLAAVVEKIIVSLREPLECGGYTIIPQATIGGVVYGVDGIDVDLLRQNADFALYNAKEINRGGYVPFESGLRAAITHRMLTVRGLDRALNEQRALPFYQPLVDLKSGAINGLEALARIRRKDGRIVTAGQFHAALSDPNIATKLTDQMLKHVANDMQAWQKEGLVLEHVGINLSSADFQRPDLDKRLADTFAAVEVPLHRILIEVTETVIMNGKDEKIERVIDGLRTMGMRVALDDFGTGYASLTHLISFPVDVIKIDKSFVDRMLSDRASRLIVELLVELASKLDARVVAEGVETEEQADSLRALGCTFGQGYFFARPADADVTARRLRVPLPGQESAKPSEPTLQRA